MEGYTRQSRTLIEYLEQVEKKKFLEILECEKQFKANPVPDFIHKRAHSGNKSLQETVNENKDFKNTKEIKSKHIDSKKSNSINNIENLKLDNSECNNSKINKKDVYIPNKKKEFLMKENPIIIKQRPQSTQDLIHRSSVFKDPTFTPKINKYIPDHDKQYKNFLKHFAIQGQPKSTTVCKPFNLHSPIPNFVNKEKQQNENEKNKIFRRGSTGQLLVFMDAIPPRMTHTSLLRCANIKNKKITAFESTEKIVRSEKLKKIQDKDLIKIVKEKAYVKNIDAEIEKKLKSHRQSNRDRELNYRHELELIKNKLKKRPLLLEQINKKKLIASNNKYKENHLNKEDDDPQLSTHEFKSDNEELNKSDNEELGSNSPKSSAKLHNSKNIIDGYIFLEKTSKINKINSKSRSSSSSSSSEGSKRSTIDYKSKLKKSETSSDSEKSQESEDIEKKKNFKSKKDNILRKSNFSESNRSRKSSKETERESNGNKRSNINSEESDKDCNNKIKFNRSISKSSNNSQSSRENDDKSS